MSSAKGGLAVLSERTKVKAAQLDRFLSQRGIANATGNPDLDIAIVKSTNHDEVAPKEKHVRTIKMSVNMGQTSYILVHLTKRIHQEGKNDWLASLKGLIILHRYVTRIACSVAAVRQNMSISCYNKVLQQRPVLLISGLVALSQHQSG